MTLRPYQVDMIERVRAELRTHDSVMLQAPTGSGKTCMAATMLQSCANKGKRGMMLTHRVEILQQASATFQKFGIQHGIISAGFTPFLMAPIQIASIDTLRYRLTSGRVIPQPDLLVIDEAHHTVATTWSKVKKHFSGTKVVGLSATPCRTDDKGLRDEFQAMVLGPSISELIDQGFLSQYRAFAPPGPDMSGVHSRMGDYIKAEAAEVMDKPAIVGDAISHYLKLARGKKFISRCVSVEHSKHVAAQFRAAGVLCWHVDGTTPRGERMQAMAALKSGDLIGLTNVDLFDEGVDVADVSVFIDQSPTKSLRKAMQGWGRVLRPMDGKVALILDHAGNVARHGLPCQDREWSLDGREARKKSGDSAPPVRQCPKCYHCHRPAPVCPACGWSYEAKARQVDEVEGTLEEIDLEAQRRAQKYERLQEQDKARTLGDLIAIGKKRGYASPEKWASHLFTARLAKQGLDKWRKRS